MARQGFGIPQEIADARQNVSLLARMFRRTRGVGHTRALVEGAKRTEHAVIVVHSHDYARDLMREHPSVEARSFYDSNFEQKLLGSDTVLLVDNGLIMHLMEQVSEALSEGFTAALTVERVKKALGE